MSEMRQDSQYIRIAEVTDFLCVRIACMSYNFYCIGLFFISNIITFFNNITEKKTINRLNKTTTIYIYIEQ